MMEVFLYLIGISLAVSGFGFVVSKINDEVVRTVCLALGGVLLFFGGLAGLFML